MIEIELPGNLIVEAPDGATPEQIKNIVLSVKAAPAFEQTIDKQRGAPATVRSAVGGSPLEDRLSNLRRYYPDAAPYGEDNFVFTDPETKLPTFYNPKGFDAGDVASVAREAVQTVGSFAGAAVGAGGGAISDGLGGAIVGGIAGAGLGSALGGAAYDRTMEVLGQIDTRGTLQRVGDFALDAVAGSVGEGVGRLVDKGLRAVAGGPGRSATQYLLDKFNSLKITPPAGAVSQSRAIQTVEQALESSPVSASIMQQRAEQVLSETRTAADTLAKKFGPVMTPQGAGETIRQAAVRRAERFNFTQEKAYDDAFSMIGADRPVAVDAVTTLRGELEVQLSHAPQALESTLRPAINLLKDLEADAAQGGLPFDALRQIRTVIGQNLDSPMLSGSSGAQNAAMRRVYGALTEDMSAAAKAVGPDAARALDVADRYTRAYMNGSAKLMEKIVRFDTDERAYQFAMAASYDGGSTLARLRRQFEPEEWDVVAGTVLGRMGLARASVQDATGEVFSVGTFLTNWNKLSPEAKKALFGGKRYAGLADDLDNLVTVASSLKGTEALANRSNTARALITHSVLTTLGGGLGGLLGGDVQSASGGALAFLGGSVVAPRVAAKLITSPSFVKWLSTPVATAKDIPAHLTRLTAIAKAEPEIKEEVQQFIYALRPVGGGDNGESE